MHYCRSLFRPGALTRAGSVFFLALALVAGALPGPALAHGGKRNNVYAALGNLPKSLADVTIQVHENIQPQLVLENKTDQDLAVLDSHGRAFLRIGPEGVLADRRAPAWYAARTSVKNLPLPPGVNQDAKPQWVRISRDPSYGWFDPRVATHDKKVDHDIVDAGKATDIGHWSIPVRIGDRTTSIDGTFKFVPPPDGSFQQRLTSSWQPADGVMVDISAGRVPGISIANNSKQTVTVMGVDDAPFLRFTDHGVFANTASRSWAQSGRVSDNAPFVTSDKPHWQKVSRGRRYTWIEPRGAYDQASPPDDTSDDKPTPLLNWKIPMRIGDASSPLTGVTSWFPVKHSHKHASHPHHHAH